MKHGGQCAAIRGAPSHKQIQHQNVKCQQWSCMCKYNLSHTVILVVFILTKCTQVGRSLWRDLYIVRKNYCNKKNRFTRSFELLIVISTHLENCQLVLWPTKRDMWRRLCAFLIISIVCKSRVDPGSVL